MKITPRDQLIAAAIGAVILIGLLFALLVYPMFGKLSSMESQINTATSQVSMAQAQLAKRQEIKNNAAVTGSSLLQLANEIPENPELPSLIIELQEAAYDNDVTLSYIKPGDLGSNLGYATVPVELKVIGGWRENVDFLQALRHLTRQIRIVGFESTRDDREAIEAGYGPYSVANIVRIEAYVIPSASKAGTSTVPAAPAVTTAQ